MKLSNFRNESNSDGTKDTNNSAKWTLGSTRQELIGKIEEPKQQEAETPNPKKAPLNYIENMWEWESTQKKYLKEIEEKQQELAAIISSYEDKWDELDSFRKAKSELEIKLIKTMGIISYKLMEYNDFLMHVNEKIATDDTSWNDWEDIENLENVEDEETDQSNNEEIDEEISNENLNNNSNDDEYQAATQFEKIKEVLSTFWINAEFRQISINQSEASQASVWEFYDQVSRVIDNFLNLVDHGNREENKKSLNSEEIEWIENLYATIKKHSEDYMELSHQIEIIDAKIEKLESEESQIFSAYQKSRKETEKMGEDMEKVSETYFLNSYLSTKDVHLDSFISTPLVERQITNIIESNKKWNTIPKTILLYWKPNLWKTYAANVLASELWRKMYHIKSYDIFTWWFSDPNAMLDAIFNWAIKKKEPCIIFLDEIENFAWWYEWSPYQNLMENTIRHHISKIKDSSLDIMVIWAISDKNKVWTSLLKQDVFSKQIYFDTLSEDKCIKFIKQIAKEYNINLNIDIDKLVNSLKDDNRSQESIKKLINIAIDFHKMGNEETENITLLEEDFDKAIKYILDYNRSMFKWVWF